MKLFGFCYKRQQHPVELIKKIYQEPLNQGSAPRGVTIEAEGQKFTSSPLSTIERHWLIQEIEQWLGLDSDLT